MALDKESPLRAQIIEKFTKVRKRIIELTADDFMEMDHTIERRIGHEDTIEAKNLSFNRGWIVGLLDMAEMLEYQDVVDALRPKYEALDSEESRKAIVNAKPEDLRELVKVIINFPLPPVADAFYKIFIAMRMGKDINTILTENPGPDAEWLERALDLVYQYGYYQGGVWALELLTKGEEKALAAYLMNLYYSKI